MLSVCEALGSIYGTHLPKRRRRGKRRREDLVKEKKNCSKLKTQFLYWVSWTSEKLKPAHFDSLEFDPTGSSGKGNKQINLSILHGASELEQQLCSVSEDSTEKWEHLWGVCLYSSFIPQRHFLISNKQNVEVILWDPQRAQTTL